MQTLSERSISMADQIDNLESLHAARNILKISLEKSKSLASALDEAGTRLEPISRRWLSLEASVNSLRTKRCLSFEIGDHIDRAIGPTAAVLRVFQAVCLLEKSLSTHPCTADLCSYISDVKRLEEALKFLTDNCKLAIRWLEAVDGLLDDNTITTGLYRENVNTSMRILQELSAMGVRARADGGLLSAAFRKLEVEFRQLLTNNTPPSPLSFKGVQPDMGDGDIDSSSLSSQLPAAIIAKLQAILERLNSNGRLDKCIGIYVEVRGLNTRRSLQTLDLSYHELSVIDLENMHDIENQVDQWRIHLELVVKHLLEVEYRLSCDVFQKFGSDIWTSCFAKVSMESGIISFLQFGKNVTETKRDPIKLLRLLDLFAALNYLRLDFNRLFHWKACQEIQTLTRDLVKRVVDGACEIFWQLPDQVELQRHISLAADGNVPRLVSFVTEYCDHLVGEKYRTLLEQVLEIQLSWRHEKYEEGILLISNIYNVMKQVALNLDTWSKHYEREDISLAYFFMMNNHCHFSNLRGTKLGDRMGNSWLKAHDQYKEYYAALYLRESWGKLIPLITGKGLVSSKVQSLDDRLSQFNSGFDERYKKQCRWIICDDKLREKVHKHLVEGIVPNYRACVQNCRLSAESDADIIRHAKYSVRSLENMLSTLFQPKLSNDCGSVKHANLIGRTRLHMRLLAFDECKF